MDGLVFGERVSVTTKDVTNRCSDYSVSSQVIENMVDVTGIDPATPCLLNHEMSLSNLTVGLWTLVLNWY
jgi:hypothetical protein